MIENKNILIVEIVLLLATVGLFLAIFLVTSDSGPIKFISPMKLMTQYNSISALDTKLESTKKTYAANVSSVETAKNNFDKEKTEYDAISDETVNIIKEATTDEKYNIEYMWIKLGNYATSNNLTLTLVEPGGEGTAESSTSTSTTTSTTTPATNTTTGASSDKTSTTTGTKTSTETTETTETATTDTNSSANEFSITVKGNYINVSDFIFELENDKELRFKLDKIKMEYAGNNQISATFVVKNLVFKK